MGKLVLSGVTAAAALLAAGAVLWAGDHPASAQVFNNGTTMVAAATAGNGATDMWAIDPRTNQVIYCRSTGGAPACKTVLVPGAAQPLDKLPR
jgi:hypothetical protein